PFDLQKVPAPPGFEGIPIADLQRDPAHTTMDDKIIEERSATMAAPLKVASGCLKTIRTDRLGSVRQLLVLNTVDTEKGYQIDSVQILSVTIDDAPDGRVTGVEGYEECSRRVYTAINTLTAVDGWPPKPGTKRRVLLEGVMPPGYYAETFSPQSQLAP